MCFAASGHEAAACKAILLQLLPTNKRQSRNESLFRVLRMRDEFFGMEFKVLSVQPKPKKAPKQEERPDVAASERPCEDVKTSQTL